MKKIDVNNLDLEDLNDLPVREKFKVKKKKEKSATVKKDNYEKDKEPE